MEKAFFKEQGRVLGHILILIAAICIAYFKVLHAPFSAWDDDEYVVQNAAIRNIGVSNVYAWFSKAYVGNYTPFAMFTFAVDYLIGGYDTFYYHFTNVVLHILNTILLYFLIVKFAKDSLVALFTALLFALAPTQIEAVSWISERKTLLCTFFYLLALLQYLFYLKKPGLSRFILLLILGIAAMLSKAIAVALPVALFAIDIWLKRSIKTKRIWLEKIPLLLISIVVGMIAIKAEAAGKFLGLHPEYDFWRTIPLASHTYLQYIVHLLLPIHLSLYYPYPPVVGFWEYTALVCVLIIVILFVLAFRKGWNIFCGGILFYTVNIFLVLQFVQFSNFLMVDHYSYIASIGLYYPVVYYFIKATQNRIAATIGISAFSLTLLGITFIRNDIWLSEVNFFNDVIKDYPESAIGQYTLGAMYMRSGNYGEAEVHIDNSLRLDPVNYKAWYNKGVLELRKGNAGESLNAFDKCIAIYPYTDAYFSRALLHMSANHPIEATADADKTLIVQPGNARAWYIKAMSTLELGDDANAIYFASKAINVEDNEPLFYMVRGKAYFQSGKNQLALSDFNKVIGMDESKGEANYYRGVLKYKMGQNPCMDFAQAKSKGYKIPKGILDKVCH